MGLLDDALDQADDANVSNWVQDIVVIALWIPPILVLFAIAISMLGIGVRTALYGDLPDFSGAGGVLDSELALLGLGGVIIGLYWLLARATFGGKTVDDAVDSGVEAADKIDDVRDD